MKLGQALNIYHHLTESAEGQLPLISREDFPFKLSYAIERTMAKINPYVAIYAHKRSLIIQELGIIPTDEGRVEVPEDKREEFTLKHEEIINEETDVEVFSVKPDIFSDHHHISAKSISILKLIGILKD